VLLTYIIIYLTPPHAITSFTFFYANLIPFYLPFFLAISIHIHISGLSLTLLSPHGLQNLSTGLTTRDWSSLTCPTLLHGRVAEMIDTLWCLTLPLSTKQQQSPDRSLTFTFPSRSLSPQIMQLYASCGTRPSPLPLHPPLPSLATPLTTSTWTYGSKSLDPFLPSLLLTSHYLTLWRNNSTLTSTLPLCKSS